MTGFARATGQDEVFSWAWEVKSVNGKSLDLRVRVPSGFDRLEVAARKLAADRLGRGSVTLVLAVDAQGAGTSYRVNRDLLEQILVLKDELSDVVAQEPPTLEGLLAIRGMIELIEPEEDQNDFASRDGQFMTTLEAALSDLIEMRTVEGRRLSEVVAGLLDRIGALIARARESAAAQPEAIAQRLRDMLDELLSSSLNIPEDRLAQEASLIVGRADVREEMDRLAVHLASARDLIAGTGPMGRKLDFLCQEFNREANTLCSKAADMDLHGTGLELKAAVDQLREQIQNIE